MHDDHVWELEQQLWLEGSHVYDELLDQQCVMAFSSPCGILQGPEIAQSLQGVPRWRTVAMTERTVGRPDAHTIVLGYRAEAQRADAQRYKAFCTSTYRLVGERCKLVQHQQTPID